jgi:hypothetical protein
MGGTEESVLEMELTSVGDWRRKKQFVNRGEVRVHMNHI